MEEIFNRKPTCSKAGREFNTGTIIKINTPGYNIISQGNTGNYFSHNSGFEKALYKEIAKKILLNDKILAGVEGSVELNNNNLEKCLLAEANSYLENIVKIHSGDLSIYEIDVEEKDEESKISKISHCHDVEMIEGFVGLTHPLSLVINEKNARIIALLEGLKTVIQSGQDDIHIGNIDCDFKKDCKKKVVVILIGMGCVSSKQLPTDNFVLPKVSNREQPERKRFKPSRRKVKRPRNIQNFRLRKKNTKKKVELYLIFC